MVSMIYNISHRVLNINKSTCPGIIIKWALKELNTEKNACFDSYTCNLLLEENTL